MACRSRIRYIKLTHLVVMALVFGLLVLFGGIYQTQTLYADGASRTLPLNFQSKVRTISNTCQSSDQKPVVWIYRKMKKASYLSHVFAVFERLGYVEKRDGASDWDVMWAHKWPFRTLRMRLADLKPHQRISKFPGSGQITIKTNLITDNIPQFPKAFKIPQQKDEFLEYARSNPDFLWVEKSAGHRGISIKALHKLDLTSAKTFVQQFIGDPLLIDGRRFDIGIYATLTSVDPLRVYISEGDWVIRFCAKEYYPFDSNDKEKYVVGHGFTKLWEIPSLSNLYNKMGYTFKEAVFANLRQQGYDTDLLDSKLKEIIRHVFLAKEHKIKAEAAKYPNSRHFFEMVRFDFVLDSKMNVYLMEVNMSPNMFGLQDQRIYEQTIFSMLHLVGVARSTSGTHPARSGEAEKEMQVSARDINTFSDLCLTGTCVDNCKHKDCQLCSSCLTSKDVEDLRMTYLEHVNRRQWRRVVPAPFQNQDEARNLELQASFLNMTDRNQWMARWFQQRCLQDFTWCQ